jgi:hypothetical protein
MNYADLEVREVSGRAGGKVASLAALRALPVSRLQDGMIVTVQAADAGHPLLVTYDASSDAVASNTIFVPTEAPTAGRWKVANLRTTVSVAGQNEATPAITVTGIAAADVLIEFLVFASGVPSVRALSDFTISANTVTVVANAANNAANRYLISYIDLT